MHSDNEMLFGPSIIISIFFEFKSLCLQYSKKFEDVDIFIMWLKFGEFA